MTHEERCERLQRQLDELAGRHGELLVGHATLEGKLKKQGGMIALLSVAALAVIGLLLNFLVSVNDKADASALRRVEDRVGVTEKTQDVQASMIGNLAESHREIKSAIAELNKKIDAALMALPRRKERDR